MVFKTESAFMQDIGDLKKYYTSISDRTKNSGSNTAAVKWMYMMGVEPTAFRSGGERSIQLATCTNSIILQQKIIFGND